MLSHDLAKLYGVQPKVLIQTVRRNYERFPSDFMFQLKIQEVSNLKSQFVTSSWGGVRKPPYEFTEQGIAMLSGLLNSQQAIQINIEIMRTFVNLRNFLNSHKEISEKLLELEKKYDDQFKVVFDAIREFVKSPEISQKEIGIHTKINSTSPK